MTLEPKKGSGKIAANPVPVATNADPKPTRPYASQKNWDKIGQDLKKDLERRAGSHRLLILRLAVWVLLCIVVESTRFHFHLLYCISLDLRLELLVVRWTAQEAVPGFFG